MSVSYTNPCPVCEEERTERFRLYYDGFIKLFECQSCGFVGHYAGPGRHEFPDYAIFFRDGGLPSDADLYDPQQVPNFEDMLARIGRYRPPPARLLDVGCFSGHFLTLARGHGYDVEGVEGAAAVAEHARRKMGLRITTGLYTPELLAPEQFDVITMMHVFEHVLDPSVLLAAAAHHLRRDGVIVIDVPSLWNPLMLVYSRARLKRLVEGRLNGLSAVLPQHYAYYQPNTLRRVLTKHGFEVIHLATGRYGVKYGVGNARLSAVIRAADRACQSLEVGTIFAIARKAAAS